MYSLRELGWFNIEFFSNVKNLRWIEALGLFVGYNHWTERPTFLYAAAARIKTEFNGKLPSDPEDLLTFYYVRRKILMIIRQDVFGDRIAGIVLDTHLKAVFIELGWTRENDASAIAREVERWLDDEWYYEVNPLIAGLRQLWRDSEDKVSTQKKIIDEAQKLGIVDSVHKIVLAKEQSD